MALSEELRFPAGVDGPLEQAPFDLDDLILLSEDIYVLSILSYNEGEWVFDCLLV